MSAKNNPLTAPQPIRLHLPDAAAKRVNVTLVGCGGTGSHIASSLVAIQAALADRDIAMDVTLVDRDIVEDKNVGRQLFSLADVGGNKALQIAHRLNVAFGCRFGALARAIDANDTFVTVGDREGSPLHVVIGAVDNPAARALIAQAVAKADGALWWLDCGNENHSGQIALGNSASAKDLRGSVALGMISRLPAPPVVYPGLVRTPTPRRSVPRRTRQGRGQSCAELTAAGEQSLMINRVIAAWACELLTAFLVERDPKWFALAVDLRWGGTRAYTLDLPTLSEVTGLKSDQLVEKGRRDDHGVDETR